MFINHARSFSGWSVFLIALSSMAMPLTTFALDEAQIEAIVRDKLREMHPNDRAEEWARLGPEAPKVILHVHSSTDRPDHRARLLGVLGYFASDPTVSKFLREQAQSASGTSTIERDVALRSLSGSVQGREASSQREFIATFLEDPSPALRLAAAESLRASGDAESLALAEAHARRERAPGFRERLLASGDASALPSPPLSLTPVSRSDGAPAIESARPWAGEWRGLLVRVGARAEEDPKALPLTLKLAPSASSRPSGVDWSVDLTLDGRQISVSDVRALAAGEGVQFRAAIDSSGADRFEARFHRDPEQATAFRRVQLRAEKSGAVGLLRQALPSPAPKR